MKQDAIVNVHWSDGLVFRWATFIFWEHHLGFCCTFRNYIKDISVSVIHLLEWNFNSNFLPLIKKMRNSYKTTRGPWTATPALIKLEEAWKNVQTSLHAKNYSNIMRFCSWSALLWIPISWFDYLEAPIFRLTQPSEDFELIP